VFLLMVLEDVTSWWGRFGQVCNIWNGQRDAKTSKTLVSGYTPRLLQSCWKACCFVRVWKRDWLLLLKLMAGSCARVQACLLLGK